jgi:hypothetical protein
MFKSQGENKQGQFIVPWNLNVKNYSLNLVKINMTAIFATAKFRYDLNNSLQKKSDSFVKYV